MVDFYDKCRFRVVIVNTLEVQRLLNETIVLGGNFKSSQIGDYNVNSLWTSRVYIQVSGQVTKLRWVLLGYFLCKVNSGSTIFSFCVSAQICGLYPKGSMGLVYLPASI